MKNKPASFVGLNLAVLLLILSSAGCESPKSEKKETFDVANAKMEIEKVNSAFMENLKKGDSAALANGYARKAKLMAPNAPAATDRAGIQSIFASIINSGATNINLKAAEVWGSDDLLTEEGTYTLATADGTQVDKGKYLVLWKKEDGNWKLFRDIFNSDLPLPAAE